MSPRPTLLCAWLFGLSVSFSGAAPAPARAGTAEVTVSYDHRYVPNNFAPLTAPEGSVKATFTATEPVTLATADSTVTLISPTEYEHVFAWDWPAPKTIAFVTAALETLEVTATPQPPWSLDLSRTSLPVIHVQTDSTSLWDPETGIYVRGLFENHVQTGSDWERPATLDIYDANDSLVVSEPIGLRIHGGSSRRFDQKGLRFYFDDYGTDDVLLHDFFGGAPIGHERLIVRQARRPIFAINDAFVMSIFGGFGHLHSRGAFYASYLNGEYWGAYTLRERIEDKLIEVTYGITDPYILQKDGEPENGDFAVWEAYLDSFGTATDYETHAWFREVEPSIDLDSYIDWVLLNSFTATADNGFDFNGATLSVDGGPWQYIMWDMDSIMFASNVGSNHFRFYAAEDQSEYNAFKPITFPYPWTADRQRWCTKLNRLMHNVEFRVRLRDRAESLLANEFSIAATHARLDSLAALQQVEMEGDHADRWGEGTLTYAGEITRTKDWLSSRHPFLVSTLDAFYEHFATPVEMTHFSAVDAGTQVDLEWTTDREIDNVGFILYRAINDPGALVPIAAWDSDSELVGQGTTSTPTNYSFTDSSPVPGALHYYVLHRVDSSDSSYALPWVEVVDRRSWATLALNEVLADNAGGAQDGEGEFEPWIELVNTGGSAVSLDSVWVSNDAATPLLHRLEGGLSVPAGGRLLLWADGETTEGDDHLGFGLDPAGGQVLLTLPDGSAPIDSTTFGAQLPDRGWQRFPDGTGAWTYGATPTPAAPNAAPDLPRFAALNEAQSENASTITDGAGDSDPWVEIANPLPVAIPTTGLHLTATPGASTGWALPDTTIAAHGYLLLWADAEPGEGPLHADFALAPAGGFLGLRLPAGAGHVDSVTFVSPGVDGSSGRMPNAVGPWTDLNVPTPGSFNPTPVPVLFLNEFVASNDTGLQDEAGDFDDWLEIYNPNASPVALGGLHLTDDLGEPTQWEFPDTTIAPHGYLIVWCDEEDHQGPLHADFKLGAGGEEIGLYGGAAHLFAAIDTHVFGAQTTDVAEGRAVDGGLPWIAIDPPTPGAPNAAGVDVPSLGPALPDRLTLAPAYPNPFRGATTIPFALPRAGVVRVDVFDVTGRRVRRVLEGRMDAGSHALDWNGRDSRGAAAAAGVYFIRLELEGERRTDRIIRLR